MPFQLVAMFLLAQAPVPAEPQLQELTRRVDAAISEHRNLDAVGMLDKALKTSPQWRHGWWLLGSILYDMDDYAAARPVLQRLIQLDPKSGAPWTLLGLCEFEMKDYGLALQHLQKGDAFGVPPELDLLDVVRYHEALLLMLAERFDTAQVVLDHLAREGRDTDEVAMAQGMCALRIPVFPESLRYLASEDRIGLIRQVGQAQHLMAMDKLVEASESYKELVRRNPAVANLHLSYAALLAQMRLYPESEAEFRAELKVNPQSVEARLGLCIRLEEAAPSDALSLAREAVALDPKSFKTHFALGKLLLKAEKFAESARELEIARDMAPSSSMVRFTLVRAYQFLGREADAGRETAAFKRLRAAEEQFRKTGQVPSSYFEADSSATAASKKGHAAPKPKMSQAPAPR